MGYFLVIVFALLSLEIFVLIIWAMMLIKEKLYPKPEVKHIRAD